MLRKNLEKSAAGNWTYNRNAIKYIVVRRMKVFSILMKVSITANGSKPKPSKTRRV